MKPGATSAELYVPRASVALATMPLGPHTIALVAEGIGGGKPEKFIEASESMDGQRS